jgi:hypothetical protein
MEAAAKILIVGGMVNLVYAFLTGTTLSVVRTRQDTIPKYLGLAHVGPLMWAPLLWGLVVVLPLSELSRSTEAIAAGCMVASSVLLGLKDTLYWLQGVEDEFSQKPNAFVLNIPLTLAFAAGTTILTVGVLRGL